MAMFHSTEYTYPLNTEPAFSTYRVCEPTADDASVSQAAQHLARNVRLLRTVRGWSQETLALNAGLDRTFVGAVERAERNVTLATAEKLANAFDLSVADLLAAQSSEVLVKAMKAEDGV